MLDRNVSVSLATIHRLPIYLRILRKMQKEGNDYASSSTVAQLCNENPSVVKKDLSAVLTSEGQPKLGYSIASLINDIESFLGYNKSKDAVVIGCGKLGQALLGYVGFGELGLNLVGGFDINPSVCGTTIHGREILPMEKMKDYVQSQGIRMAILTLPKSAAQETANILIDAGIKAIWNFSHKKLNVPDDVAVLDEDLATSLAILSIKLDTILAKEGIN
ncbi:MAG: redox-sensing transcriptional repressor Rex [Sphaerochaetaceae bacterium]|nr:redox-sensing transcriptional repressor Rex [Sphaerochaetaceae bacterium]